MASATPVRALGDSTERDQAAKVCAPREGIPDDAARKHPFIQFVSELERRSHVARLAYPFVYLVIGHVFVATISRFLQQLLASRQSKSKGLDPDTDDVDRAIKEIQDFLSGRL